MAHPSSYEKSEKSMSNSNTRIPSQETPSLTIPRDTHNTLTATQPNPSNQTQNTAISDRNKYEADNGPPIDMQMPASPTGPLPPLSPIVPRYKPIKRCEPDVRLSEMSPIYLSQLISKNSHTNDKVLIVDVRPWNMYAYTHIHTSISICIPSTLMKRPTFGFERMLEFVSPQDVDRLRAHKDATHIVFYDQGTINCTMDSTIRRTAAKFLSASPSPEGRLYWLVGGLLAVSRDAPSIIDRAETYETENVNNRSTETVGGLGISQSTDQEVISKGPRKDLGLNISAALDTSPSSGLHATSAAGSALSIPSAPPKLTLSSVRALPRSPFSLIAERNSPLPVSFGPPTPVLDQSSKIVVDEQLVKYINELPKWLVSVIDQTSSGKNVLAEGFCKLERDERQRMYRVTGTSKPIGSPNVSKISPHEGQSGRKEYSHKQLQYMQQRSTTPLSPVAPSIPVTPATPASSNSFTSTDFTLVTGDDPRKNRYTNIAPYSHNAVKVKAGSYFNGSFITSSVSELRYIATQAPTPSAFGDFWLCVWEQRVPLIVMLTTLITDSGQVKGNKYWFNSTYDGLQVELLEEVELNGVDRGTIVRQLRLTMISTGEQRIVLQMQYLNWPDLGCPTNPSEALKLTSLKSRLMTEQNMPPDSLVIVHCSAGCGRTGTFCAIDTITDYIDKHPVTSQDNDNDLILEVVSQFRKQRIAMVQNQRQLQLCYQAIILWYYLKLKQNNEAL